MHQQGMSVEQAAAATGMERGAREACLAKENDSVETAGRIATALGVALPEIEVSDFRENGYLPEAIVNFLGLLGWNPGMKLADGKDLEKFDRAFLAEHFSIERIGKTNAKFDRQKLLSFNADAIGAMTNERFADRWLHWLEHEQAEESRGQPAAIVEILRDPVRRVWLAGAVKQRARTLRDAAGAVGVLLRGDDSTEFDKAAMEKNVRGAGGAGLALLKEFAEELKGLGEWTPTSIHTAMESFAKSKGMVTEKGVNLGALAQPIRVAVAGVGVTPPLGETLALLGRESALKRFAACISAAAGA